VSSLQFNHSFFRQNDALFETALDQDSKIIKQQHTLSTLDPHSSLNTLPFSISRSPNQNRHQLLPSRRSCDPHPSLIASLSPFRCRTLPKKPPLSPAENDDTWIFLQVHSTDVFVAISSCNLLQFMIMIREICSAFSSFLEIIIKERLD
jgi:hypothetical protein